VFSRVKNSFFSFDSNGTFNDASTAILNANLKQVLNKPDAQLQKIACLQQRNGVDCGIYAICHAEQACFSYLESGNIRSMPLLRREVVVPPPSKTSRLFEDLSLLHPSELSHQVQAIQANSTPFEQLKAEAGTLATKVKAAKRVSTDPRKFAIGSDLVSLTIVAPLNLLMDPDAVNSGNIITEDMLSPMLIRDDKPSA